MSQLEVLYRFFVFAICIQLLDILCHIINFLTHRVRSLVFYDTIKSFNLESISNSYLRRTDVQQSDPIRVSFSLLRYETISNVVMFLFIKGLYIVDFIYLIQVCILFDWNINFVIDKLKFLKTRHNNKFVSIEMMQFNKCSCCRSYFCCV